MKKVVVLRILICVGLIVLLVSPTYAQEGTCVIKCDKEEIPKLVITRKGIVEAEPDKAIVNMKIVIEETKIEKAVEKNNEKINLVIDALVQHGVEKKDIKTLKYNITPLYEGKPLFSQVHRPTSYIVVQEIKANIYKLDTIGKIISKISMIESANVYGLKFVSTKIEELKREALKKAAQSAKEVASDLAEAAGAKLGKVLRIEESYIEPFRQAWALEKPRYELMETRKKADVRETDVEAGTLEIEAYCTVTYEIEQKQ